MDARRVGFGVRCIIILDRFQNKGKKNNLLLPLSPDYHLKVPDFHTFEILLAPDGKIFPRNIDNLTRLFINEMMMRLRICVKDGRFFQQPLCFQDVLFDKKIERVVDRGSRDRRANAFCAPEHCVCAEMLVCIHY